MKTLRTARVAARRKPDVSQKNQQFSLLPFLIQDAVLLFDVHEV